MSTAKTTEHSPLPWKTSPGQIIVDSSGADIAEAIAIRHRHADLPVLEGSMAQFQERKANAALIVRAVNRHQALVDALREIIETFDAGHRDDLKFLTSLRAGRELLARARQ